MENIKQTIPYRSTMKTTRYLLYIIALVAIASCKKPYLPPVVDAPNSYLVVEGVINAGNDSTIIKLSHAVKISEGVQSKPEGGARITVESDGFSRPLTEQVTGTYFVNGLNLDQTRKYHLKIVTGSGQTYESDAVDVKITPAIDELGFSTDGGNLQILANAHDNSNNTRFYRYEYEQTWRFSSRYPSNYKVANGLVVPRPPDEQIYNCFAGERSSTIALASTSKLAQDVVKDAVVTNIASTSEKLSVRYSILVKQYALTKEAFEFWENLKKNTEQLGSVFDALPSQILGNIHNVSNPAEPVIGYISVSTVQTKRLYINKSELPESFVSKFPYDCEEGKSLYSGLQGINEVAGNILNFIYVPTGAIVNDRGVILGFSRSSSECVDCTLRGVTKAPGFWVD